jgi:transposase
MPANLKPPQLEEIRHMIESGSLNRSEIAFVANCSKQAVTNIRQNLQAFGDVRAPRNGVGRPRSITAPMLEALCEYLKGKPTLYQDEMAVYLWDEFGKHVQSNAASHSHEKTSSPILKP